MDYKIPATFPAWLDLGDDRFVSSADATAGQWRAYKKHAKDRSVSQMVRLANAFRIPDDVSLLPRLRALCSTNVVSICGIRPRGFGRPFCF
jgi:hypothetical protein